MRNNKFLISLFIILFIASVTIALIIPGSEQNLPAKLVRLEVYNWIDENVYLRLEGLITGQFYYLTIPPTTRVNWYKPKVYTIMSDIYRRTVWACGVEMSGQLRLTKNHKMSFFDCSTPKETEVDGELIIVNYTQFPVGIGLAEREIYQLYGFSVPAGSKEQPFIYKHQVIQGVYNASVNLCNGIQIEKTIYIDDSSELVLDKNCGQYHFVEIYDKLGGGWFILFLASIVALIVAAIAGTYEILKQAESENN